MHVHCGHATSSWLIKRSAVWSSINVTKTFIEPVCCLFRTRTPPVEAHRPVVTYLQFPIQVCSPWLSVCRPRPASHAHFRHRHPYSLNSSIDIILVWPCVSELILTWRNWDSIVTWYRSTWHWRIAWPLGECPKATVWWLELTKFRYELTWYELPQVRLNALYPTKRTSLYESFLHYVVSACEPIFVCRYIFVPYV